MDEEERKRIEADAKWQESVDQRIRSLEGKVGLFVWAVLGAAATLVSGIWDKIAAVIK